MSAGPIGIVYEQRAKREGAVARLSPAAKHQAFPRLYAQPVPRDTTNEALRAEIKTLTVEKAMLLREVAALVNANRALANPKPIPEIVVLPRGVTMAEALKAYCRALETVGYQIDGTPCIILDLVGPRAARVSAWPRHVAMWLCRRLCKGANLSSIGKVFGSRDHTSVRHGCQHAPLIMERSPSLKAAALLVLATFESKDGPT